MSPPLWRDASQLRIALTKFGDLIVTIEIGLEPQPLEAWNLRTLCRALNDLHNHFGSVPLALCRLEVFGQDQVWFKLIYPFAHLRRYLLSRFGRLKNQLPKHGLLTDEQHAGHPIMVGADGDCLACPNHPVVVFDALVNELKDHPNVASAVRAYRPIALALEA